MNADTITAARPADARITLAKVIHVDEGRIIGKEPSPNVVQHEFVEMPVHDLDSLVGAIEGMASQGAIAVRGKPKARYGRRAIYDHQEHGPAGLDIVPRRWCAFDWDGLPLEPQSGPQLPEIAFDDAEFASWSEPDPLLDPEIGAKIALRRLPPAFRSVSCLWQVSAGAGYNPGFRLRTWHWLDHPLIGEELKAWLRPAIERKLVDPVTLVEAQAHYLGVIVKGGPDPCPKRFGILKGLLSEVAVPDIASIMRRQEDRARAARPPAPKDKDSAEAKSYADQRIKDCIDAIRTAPDGTKHPSYKSEAARAKALCDTYSIPWEPVKRDLIAIYESTLSGSEAVRRRKAQRLA